MTMDEIRALPHNGFNAISTFSGCGGSSTGYRMAGFKILYANEFIPVARDSYNANKTPHTFLDGRDIREVNAQDILDKIGLKAGEIDLFDGSPPCASFSTAGKREKGWGEKKKYSDTVQRTDDLFFEYARLLKDLQPKTFVAENVSGLIKGTAKGYFIEILKTLKSCGYQVSAKVLDAQWLGVPQQRQRLIFVGVRDDLGLLPVHPKPFNYRYSIKDAWLDLPDTNEYREKLTPRMETWYEKTPLGKTLDIGHKLVEKNATSGFNKVRLDFNYPSCTILAKSNSGTRDTYHPDIPATPTIPELKRICGFPDDFTLQGTFAQQWERLGRAVPPVMMMHIASEIRDNILCKLK